MRIPLALTATLLATLAAAATAQSEPSPSRPCQAFVQIDSRDAGARAGTISPAGLAFFRVFKQSHPDDTVRLVSNHFPTVGPWTKSLGKVHAPNGYQAAVIQGVRSLQAQLSSTHRACPTTRLLLTGIGLGAEITGDVADSGPPDGVLGVALFADPLLNPDYAPIDRGPARSTDHGALGKRGRFPATIRTRVVTFCEPLDPICQASWEAKSPIDMHDSYERSGEPEEAAGYFSALPPTGVLQPLTAPTATQAFGEWIRANHPGAAGLWSCPSINLRDALIPVCETEFHVDDVWHLLDAQALPGRRATTFRQQSHWSWTRRWSAYSTKTIVGFDTPGVASVNTPYRDWPFLSATAYESWKTHKVVSGDAFDGPLPVELRPIYIFTCAPESILVVCTNKLGDAMRYRP